ncbi:uncharacterized protein [Musca autumnalis]|uniref:uncharacterized protein n=1 Tax=Musca autumnalis TaxID=221902 RepID=UPI003CE8219E
MKSKFTRISNWVVVPRDYILCPLCRRPHSLRKCRRFLCLPYEIRIDFIENEKICRNCLGPDHSVRHCPSKDSCQKCHRNHHSILHYYDKRSDSVLLEMTAMVYVAEFEEEEGVLWRIKMNPSQMYSSVAAWSVYKIPSLAKIKLFPATINVYIWARFEGGEKNKLKVQLKVVDQSMERTPKVPLKKENILERVKKVNIADVDFWHPGYAPITLGADVAKSIYIGAPKTNPALPMSQCTIFGWTFFGHVERKDIKEKDHKKDK